MKVLVVLIAEHRKAMKLFEQRGDKLLDASRMPATFAAQTTFVARTFDPTQTKPEDLAAFIMNGGTHESEDLSSEINGVVVLCEQPLAYLLIGLRNAIFAALIPPIPFVENVSNFLTGHFRLLLGNYGSFVQLAEDATKRQALSLPIRNFDSAALRTLVELCATRSMLPNFPNEVTVCVNDLVKLRGPKRRSSYPHVYFKDEQGRYFKYGHERHSRYETGGRHLSSCELHGRFRFGWALDQERHFNVTRGNSDAPERLNCHLPNCHDDIVQTRNSTHINMFSNDFHA